jgi:hypothetical protein
MPGKDFDMEEYYPLYRAKEYLKAIGYCDQIYGVKEADVDKKVDATWTKLQDAIEEGTRAFLKANPDKAQKIADRYAVLSFFNSRSVYNSDRFRKEGCFFERCSLGRWVNSKIGPLKDVKSDSPFRIFMDKVLEMSGGCAEEGLAAVEQRGPAPVDGQSERQRRGAEGAGWRPGGGLARGGRVARAWRAAVARLGALRHPPPRAAHPALPPRARHVRSSEALRACATARAAREHIG